jgi:hypothetical protein
MPRIIKIGELLPADFVVELSAGEQFTMPGDPPLELLLKIAELFERTENANGDAGEVGLEVLRELDFQMLELLRMRQPELRASPFGVVGVQHVVATMLQAYNFAAVPDEDEPEGDPENPPSPARSTRSSGSRSSSKSSRSRRTTGTGSGGQSSKPGSA